MVNGYAILAQSVIVAFIKKMVYFKPGEAEPPLLLTMPTYSTETEQSALLHGCNIVNIKARIVDESTATIYSYASSQLQ